MMPNSLKPIEENTSENLNNSNNREPSLVNSLSNSNSSISIFNDTTPSMKIPIDLYLKCQFLISKRSWLIIDRVKKLVTLKMTSNLIPIEEDQITEFCENRDMKKRRKDIHKDILFFDTIA